MTANKRTPTACSLWATSFVGDKPFCVRHAEAILTQKLDLARAEKKRSALDARLDEYLVWAGAYPSVWDSRLHA